MSKLIAAVKAAPTGMKFVTDPVFDSLVTIKQEYTDTLPHTLGSEYKISVELGSTVIIEEYRAVSKKNNDELVDEALKNVRKQIAEAVFGEFREELYLLRQALWKRDYYSASESLDKLEKKMFEVY